MTAPPQKNDSWGEGTFGCLILIVFAIVAAAVIFFFLGIETQRSMFFSAFGYPSVPQGSYSPMCVLSSNFEQHSFEADKYVVVIERNSNPFTAGSENDPEFPDVGILYTLECAPRFWNLCTGFVPGHDYHARWVSSEHKQLAVGEVESENGGKRHIAADKTQILDVRGWQKATE